MNAIVITAYGEPESLVLAERPVPIPRENEVLINVYAAGINRPDVFQRKGQYPAPAGIVSDIPGLEVAGVIAMCGDGVTQWGPGDRVCALVAGGGYAEYVAVNATHCLPIPDHLDFMQAACLPETVFTVWHNVFQRGRLQAGEVLLVHGGSGGIGTTAIQLAVQFGATVYATAGSDEKCRFCEQLGAIRCINYRKTDFADALSDIRIDVILDSIGAPYFERHVALLAEEGRLVFINASEGRHAPLDIMKLMRRRLTLTGSTLRARDAAFKSALKASIEQHVWPLVETGTFLPVIHRAFPLAQASDAHRLMESGDFIGKLVLTIHN
ncbi:NAD(P)H-quinone oxidoreductase [Parapedobacter indicus]|uniref:Putative NAD(P)H quinone oxidoreductase, PIG3 family n=1 Tax=Parapedobacter indicus TaxID=1477437 RepID=A0A1I3DCE4_9SPHI|nr:NAD(P)H-quinone oxidoreductase [Parapedobacter indicus]PPL04617.1 putative PIG3 family NAD(P)H quinone oxidoreductase [Parapedobacter indicus]SFH84440.1 putative NAD(P)H quinone oxidoreductase, PIG3 family [Parapedobacter indicus]